MDTPKAPQPSSASAALRQARADLYSLEQGATRTAPEDPARQEPLRRLLEVIEQVNAELDVERVLAVAAQKIIDVFEAERVFVVDTSVPERMRFHLAVAFNGIPVEHPENEVSHAVIKEVATTRKPVLVADALRDPSFAMVSSVQHLQLHSVMAAPLLARGELLGVVYVDNRMLSGAFDERALTLLQVFSNHVGIALRNARLFRDLEAARAELAQAERLKAIGQVASYVAHEIKNPLSSLTLLADELRGRWNDAAFRETAQEVFPSEIARLSNAANHILEYARPTSLLRVPVQLPELIRGVVKTFASQTAAAGVSVTVRQPPRLPDVMIDGDRVREVFVNLIGNAIQAMAASPKRTLLIEARPPSQGMVEVIVQDSGPGIAPELLPKIFDPFRSTKSGGTGLGLAFCQKVVREHGGRITAENSPGGGARFVVQLPVAGN